MAYNKDLHITWQNLQDDVSSLAALLKGKTEWAGIVAVARGGLIPAALIAQILDIKIIETICAVSYDFQAQGKLEILKKPDEIPGGGENWLVIDDLTDTGKTFAAIREFLPRATYACLYAKPAGISTADFFVREVPQDTWVHFPWEAGS